MISLTDPIVIHWFRRDLRLTDNAALYSALSSGFPVMPVFIFDRKILDQLEQNDLRVSFIYQALKKLDADLGIFQSGLEIKVGYPLEIIKELVSTHNIVALYANQDYEPYAISRDEKVRQFLQSKGIEFHTFKDQVIFEKKDIVRENGEPYTVFTPYSKKWTSLFSQKPGLAEPFKSYERGESFIKRQNESLISLQNIGFKEVAGLFSPPHLNEEHIRNYDKTRDYPALDATSRMSVHLRFGTISVRELVFRAISLNRTWLNELQWREFFMQILWHFPEVVEKPFKQQYERIAWVNNANEFETWCRGETGYPLVDAGMRELNQTGFMNNRVRMITAGFLTKHLLIDWRWGENYFARKLLDFELSSNNGNWQWAAGTGCDAAPYFRIFNPEIQASNFDPQNQYIREWVPEFGTDKYPKPIVNHAFARQRCLSTYAAVKE